MPKKAHTEEQIVSVLQQGQAGEKVADICRKVGISEGRSLTRTPCDQRVQVRIASPERRIVLSGPD